MKDSMVDFSYAFAVPHRITVARPDSSDKTLLDLYPGYVQMAWIYEDLTRKPLGAGRPPKTAWWVRVVPEMDGRSFSQSTWTRSDDYLPVLDNTYQDEQGCVKLEAAGGVLGMVCRVQVSNMDNQPHVFTVRCVSTGRGEVPGWFQRDQAADHLAAGSQKEPGMSQEGPDRILVLCVGADEYSLNGGKTLTLVWNLKPGESRTGWIIRPYRAYAADLPDLRKHDWANEFASAKKEWRDLLNRAVRVQIPDTGVERAFYACIGDLFIMREPMADGYVGAILGTEVYRSNNSTEPSFAAVALDQVGFHKEAEVGFRVSLVGQGDDGCWAIPPAWDNKYWHVSGFKSLAIMEHYRLTRDRKYLADVYPRMLASSRWQERQRARARILEDGKRPLTYGMLSGAREDCGLLDASGKGFFFAHNIWPVYADRLTIEAAEILGKTEDLPELREIYEHGLEDLLQCLEAGSIQAEGYRWIPGSPGQTSGSQWGTLHILFPCGILPPDHELVTGTIRYMESNLSPGGLILLSEGRSDHMWVSTTLDHLAAAYLARGEGDAFAKCLYAVLNHGTPLYTWSEMRGKDPGSEIVLGDRQHLYSPVVVVQAIRYSLVMEDRDVLHLACGTAREWLASGRPVGIAKAPTHFGLVSFQIQYDSANRNVNGIVVFPSEPSMKWAVLHIRLPNGLKVKSVNAESGAVVLPDGSGIKWQAPRGEQKVVAMIKDASGTKPPV